VPRQTTAYAELTMDASTPYDVRDQKQKKAVVNLPTTGPRRLVIDRSQTYVIEALFSAPAAVSLEEASNSSILRYIGIETERSSSSYLAYNCLH
jgi:hypothetical protein